MFWLFSEQSQVRSSKSRSRNRVKSYRVLFLSESLISLPNEMKTHFSLSRLLAAHPAKRGLRRRSGHHQSSDADADDDFGFGRSDDDRSRRRLILSHRSTLTLFTSLIRNNTIQFEAMWYIIWVLKYSLTLYRSIKYVAILVTWLK